MVHSRLNEAWFRRVLRWTLSLTGASLLGSAALASDQLQLGDLSFKNCEIVNRDSALTWQAKCAELTVPENRQQPGGREIQLHMALLNATGRKPLADPVVLLAGGPGQSAIDSWPSVRAALERLREQRHILLLDQRGTGRSHRLSCSFEGLDAEALVEPQAAAVWAASCAEQLQTHADPARYTTEDAVADLEAVRQAIGAPQLNLIGVSYGTRMGLHYLRRHAEGVRSMVLDGIAPPEVALPEVLGPNLDRALAALFEQCRADAVCQARFNDPAATLALLRSELAISPLLAEVHDPLSHRRRQERLTLGTLRGVVRMYAYQPEFSTLLPLLLDETAQGRPHALISQGLMLARTMSEQMAIGMQFSVICSEDAPWVSRNSEAREDSLFGHSLRDTLLAQCASWPSQAAAADFHDPVRSPVPSLLLSGEFDPVTPPEYGEQVAQHLSQSRHLVLAGQGHNVLIRGCAPKLIADFIRDLDAAALDASCLDALNLLPPFVGFHGPEA